MTIDAYLFDFPGRSYTFQHADFLHVDFDGAFPALSAVLHALTRVVAPTVVELIDETNTIFHLVEGSAKGGAYIRDPARTVSVPRIDAERLVAWFGEVTHGGAALTTRSIADGWFPVDAAVGELIRLREGPGLAEGGSRCARRRARGARSERWRDRGADQLRPRLRLWSAAACSALVALGRSGRSGALTLRSLDRRARVRRMEAGPAAGPEGSRLAGVERRASVFTAA